MTTPEIRAALEAFLKERNAALTSLDLEWARARIGDKPKEVLLGALHKARYECTDIAAELRHTSGHWLRERGYSRIGGFPLLPEGALPE